MFNLNKRRTGDTFLKMENGKVVTHKEEDFDFNNTPIFDKNDTENIKVRNYDEMEDGNLDTINNEKSNKDNLKNEEEDFEEKNKDLETEEDFEAEYDKNENIINNNRDDMKVSLFNIFKFMFIFCIVFLILFGVFKVFSVVSSQKQEYQNSLKSNIETTSNDNSTSDDTNVVKKIDKDKEKDITKIKEKMTSMNNQNAIFMSYYDNIKRYCTSYSENYDTVYAFEKNLKSSKEIISTDYINFLNTESSFTNDTQKELFGLYKQRYDNLIKVFDNLPNENRATVSDALNNYINSDNTLNKQEFDILIEELNANELSYKITDNEIILNE